MSLPLVLVLYALSAALLVFFSIKLANYVDLLDKKTNMSGAFIGGVVLAAVTSLPELVTSCSSVFVVNSPELIIGNVLGSNVFNLCIFGATTALAVKSFSKAPVGKAHIAALICTLAAYGLMAVSLFAKIGDVPVLGEIPFIYVNIASLLILAIYFISFRFLSNDDSESEEEDTSSLTVKQIIVRFVFMALGLVIMSVIVTMLTDELQRQLTLDVSLAGALFLGIATSLPELSSSIALVRYKNFNAMVGNVVGSNMFNFTIFSIADIISGTITGIYPPVPSVETKNMLLFGVIATVLVMVSLLLHGRWKDKATKGVKLAIYAVLGVLILASYLASMMLQV